MVKTAVLFLVVVGELNAHVHGSYVFRGKRQTQTLVKKKFHVENETMATWYEALYHCRNHGGRLAAVESAEEHDDVIRLITNAGKRLNLFWIGGSDEIHEGRWVWNTTGSDISSGFTAWQTGQPNNMSPGQHCLGYSQYHTHTTAEDIYRAGFWWVDSDCDIRSAFVCQQNH